MDQILDIRMKEDEIFYFEGDLYHGLTIPIGTNQGTIFLIDDTFIKAEVFESVLNQLGLGIQVFDDTGRLIFLNETCRRIESLIKQNVLRKHLREIYAVDEDYSTILTTLKTRELVKDRCDTFANRFGDAVTSINSGYPIYIAERFFGAFGIVLDESALSDFSDQQEILQRFVTASRGKVVSNYHISRYYTFSDMIGEAGEFQKAIDIAQKVAQGDFPVLLLGETGTGKELFAQSIHSASLRSKKNFVAINCSAIPPTILESTLFGTVKGSFTGSGNQRGLLDEADGGTLFLDEINAMDIQVQTKLLRVLQEKNFRRVGGLKDINCDFRIIAAMNESPERAIAENRLREDLYYRLNTITIELPPLRSRGDDILLLIEYYLEKLNHGAKEMKTISEDVYPRLRSYDWPGNVRELFHMLEHAYAIADEKKIARNHFPQRLFIHQEKREVMRKDNLHYDINRRLKEQEKQMIEEALELCENNVSAAAKLLNLSRQSLQHRIRKHQLNIRESV